VLIGGACEPTGEALGAFLDLRTRARAARSSGSPPPRPTRALGARVGGGLRGAGADNVEIPIIDRRDQAQDRRVAR
jgi:cyanophycinase